MNILKDVTIFDFETTGIEADKERVIEMAAMRVINNEIICVFSTLVHPEKKLSDKITEITGITDEMLKNAMSEQLAFRILKNIIGDSLIVAHNAAFDLQFYHYALNRLSGKTFDNKFIDTMTISRDRSHYPHKLIDMCRKYDVNLEGAHRALNDVEGCWGLLKALHNEKPIDDYVNKLGYLSKFSPPAWTPSYADVYGVVNTYEPRGK